MRLLNEQLGAEPDSELSADSDGEEKSWKQEWRLIYRWKAMYCLRVTLSRSEFAKLRVLYSLIYQMVAFIDTDLICDLARIYHQGGLRSVVCRSYRRWLLSPVWCIAATVFAKA